jgi:hypothetical protein
MKTVGRFPRTAPLARIERRFVFMLSLIVGTIGSVSARVAACAGEENGIRLTAYRAMELTTALRVRKVVKDLRR